MSIVVGGAQHRRGVFGFRVNCQLTKVSAPAFVTNILLNYLKTTEKLQNHEYVKMN